MGGGAADDSEESLSGAIPAAPALKGMGGGGQGESNRSLEGGPGGGLMVG